jgi:hypothetical protein
VFVGAIEQAGDGVDQDCDARELCYVDGDQDGFRVANTVTTADLSCAAAGLALAAAPGPDCDDGDASIYPGAPDDPADGIDQDCDEATSCLADLDLDSYADPLAFVLAADGDCTDLGELPLGSPVDCDDSDPLVNPGAAETPADFIDSDCDGQELCFVDFDGDGWAIDDTVGSFDLACDELGEAPAGAPQGDCDDGDAGVSPAAVEGIADGVDADCNGVELCYVDGDGDGWRVGEEVIASFELACQGDGYADATAPEGDCDDADVSRNPDAEEGVGDEVDQDCDGGEALLRRRRRRRLARGGAAGLGGRRLRRRGRGLRPRCPCSTAPTTIRAASRRPTRPWATASTRTATAPTSRRPASPTATATASAPTRPW